MVSYNTCYILVKCRYLHDKFNIFEFNGLSDRDFHKIWSCKGSSLVMSMNVHYGLNSLHYGDEFELLVKCSYKEHHCEITNLKMYFYKIRKPKCKFGLKPTDFSLKRYNKEG